MEGPNGALGLKGEMKHHSQGNEAGQWRDSGKVIMKYCQDVRREGMAGMEERVSFF